MSVPTFILGAGFCADAASEAGESKHYYPLLDNLLKDCFGLTSLPQGKSIENLFDEAMQDHNRKPLKALYEKLMAADYHITPKLRDCGGRENAYLRFLRYFEDAFFLTFNYDSFIEILLMSLKRWRPDDGYGVSVDAKVKGNLIHQPPLPECSRNLVLHLHGTLCIYSSDYYIRPGLNGEIAQIEFKEEPDFIFDPDSITSCFFPFERPIPTTGFCKIEERVIAPIPNKAKGIKEVFIQRVHTKAMQFLRESKEIVVIGYQFNPHDHSSYQKLIQAATGSHIFLVLPEADELQARLKKEFPSVTWRAIPLSFKNWVNEECPLG